MQKFSFDFSLLVDVHLFAANTAAGSAAAVFAQ